MEKKRKSQLKKLFDGLEKEVRNQKWQGDAKGALLSKASEKRTRRGANATRLCSVLKVDEVLEAADLTRSLDKLLGTRLRCVLVPFCSRTSVLPRKRR